MIFTQIIVSIVLICITIVTHAFVLDRLLKVIDYMSPIFFKKFHDIWKIIILITVAISVMASISLHCWLWAFLYLLVGVMPDLEEALYFSTTTYSTVGYGDIILDKDWRLASAIESANGLMIFGWSTAFIFEVMSKLYDTSPFRRTK